MKPKYPNIEVDLLGHDANPATIIGTVARALRRGGVKPEEIDEFRKEATSGDYDNVLQTCFRWVEVN